MEGRRAASGRVSRHCGKRDDGEEESEINGENWKRSIGEQIIYTISYGRPGGRRPSWTQMEKSYQVLLLPIKSSDCQYRMLKALDPNRPAGLPCSEFMAIIFTSASTMVASNSLMFRCCTLAGYGHNKVYQMTKLCQKKFGKKTRGIDLTKKLVFWSSLPLMFSHSSFLPFTNRTFFTTSEFLNFILFLDLSPSNNKIVQDI